MYLDFSLPNHAFTCFDSKTNKIRLSTRFSLKDLGSLSYFLGVETTRSSTGLLVSTKYILDRFHKTNMHEAKEIRTPLSSSESLKLDDCSPNHDPTEYRQALGSL